MFRPAAILARHAGPGASRLRLALRPPRPTIIVAPAPSRPRRNRRNTSLSSASLSRRHRSIPIASWSSRAPIRCPITRASPGAIGCRVWCRPAWSRPFQNSGAVKSVGTRPATTRSPPSCDPSRLTLRTARRRRCRSLRQAGQQFRQGRRPKVFTARVNAPSDAPTQAVAALNQAFTEVMQDTTTWVGSRR